MIDTPQLFQIDASQPLDWNQHLTIEIEPRKNINYSLLHNGGSLFERFYIHNRSGKRIAQDSACSPPIDPPTTAAQRSIPR